MEDRLRQWIESKEMPADFYELLGLSRLDSNRTSVEAAIQSAYRMIHPYQNHRDAQRAARAQQLQMLLGDVCNTISDPAKWRNYDAHIIDDLREQYAQKNGREVNAWKREGLRRWLSAVKNVHSHRVEALVSDFLATEGETVEQPKPESLFVEDDNVSRLKQVFRSSVRPPNPNATAARIYSSQPQPRAVATPRPGSSGKHKRPGSGAVPRPEKPATASSAEPQRPNQTPFAESPSASLGWLVVVLIAGLILTVFAAGLGVLVWVALR